MRKKSVILVAITSVISSIICVIGLGLTLYDYFNTPANDEIEASIKDDPNEEEERTKIVALGDSLTRGTGDSEGKGYVGYLVGNLEKKTEQKLALSNMGIRGLTSVQLAAQVQEKEIQRQVETADIIVITIGGNDLFRKGEGLSDLSPESLKLIEASFDNNLNVVLSELRKVNKEAEIFLIGLYNPFIELENAEQTSQIVRAWNYKSAEIAANYPNTVFVPTFDLFQLNVNEYLYTDQFHPNTKGYQLIGERIASLITM